MKRIVFISISFFLFSLYVNAENNMGESEPETFSHSISSYNPAFGKVTINQDERLASLIEYRNNISKQHKLTSITCEGYRIQIYSGNSPKTSKEEAFAFEQQIKADFPELATYVSFSAPFWKLRLGDFVNYQEAVSACNLLKKNYPKIQNTIFVVKEDAIVVY